MSRRSLAFASIKLCLLLFLVSKHLRSFRAHSILLIPTLEILDLLGILLLLKANVELNDLLSIDRQSALLSRLLVARGIYSRWPLADLPRGRASILELWSTAFFLLVLVGFRDH